MISAGMFQYSCRSFCMSGMQSWKFVREIDMKNGKIEKTYYAYLLPVVLAIIVLPLAVKACKYYNPSAVYPWNSGTKHAADVFLLIKQHILYIIMGLIFFCLLCFALLRRTIFCGTKQMLCLAGYLGLAVLSAVRADRPYVAWHGGAERFESIFVLAGYILLFYYTYLVIRGERKHTLESRRFLFRAVGVLSLLLGIIGICQMSGYDIWQNPVVARICGIQNADFIDSERIYLSLYHSDYVGVMMTMLIPVDVAGILLEERRTGKLFFAVSAILMVICLFASQSRFGVICVLLCILIFYPLWIYRTTQKKKVIAGTLCCILGCIALFALVNLVQGHSLVHRFFHYCNTTRDNVIFIETRKDHVYFRLKDSKGYMAKLTGQGENIALRLQDADGEPADPQSGALTEIQMRREYVSYRNKTIYGYVLKYHKQECFITNQLGDRNYYFLNYVGKFDQSVLSADALPLSWYGLASYRGFVWSKTIPLLRNTFLYGTGPDGFEGIFPNNDYSSRYFSRLKKVVYNKPHSWYLQMATETGVLSAVCVIIFLVGFFWKGMRCLWRDTRSGSRENRIMLMAGMFACISYCIMGLLNDSMLVTAPVFWVLLGFTYALYREMEDLS